MSENTNESRLPPPAFPPGMRRHVHRNSGGAEAQETQEEAADAFISPDAPLPERGQGGGTSPLGGAFISPDEPIPERKIELAEEFQSATSGIDPDDEGVVVGMDLDPHLEVEEVVSGGDPHVMELMEAVGKLSDALRRKGEAGLRAAPGMSRFEATLRSYCVGYLAGRRAEDPEPEFIEESLPTDG